VSDDAERQYSRLTYLAWGEFRRARRAAVHEQCAQFHAALGTDCTAEQAAQAFPPRAREEAARAAKAIRAFEAAIGARTGAPPSHVYLPDRKPWWRRRDKGAPTYTVSTFAVGIETHFTGSLAAQDAAVEAADALGKLLTALGARQVGTSWMD